MKIALVNPGLLRVPPVGYGAIEKIIWETSIYLKNAGHLVEVIDQPTDWDNFLNEDHFNRILQSISQNNYDIIHFHSERFVKYLDRVQEAFPNSKILFTSHSPWIGRSQELNSDVYTKDYELVVKNNKYYNVCVSQKDFDYYKRDGADTSKMFVSRNGCTDKYRLSLSPKKSDRSIYLAAIERRKRQYIYQEIENIDFIGPLNDPHMFDANRENYLGTPTTEFMLDNLTDYGNLVLLTTAENGTPLVVQEALMAGLGVVISKYAAWEVDKNLPFISVVDEDKINDIEYVKNIIEKNRNASLGIRSEIRKYAEERFSWKTVAENYISNLKRITNNDI